MHPIARLRHHLQLPHLVLAEPSLVALGIVSKARMRISRQLQRNAPGVPKAAGLHPTYQNHTRHHVHGA